MAKKDIRIIKTRRALATAMFTILEKQDFQSITVNDLCTEAMVSRSTFYLHFEDKYALLRFCMEMMDQRLFGKDESDSMEAQLKGMLDRVKDNVRVVKNLMMVNLDAELFEMLRKSLQMKVERAMEEQGATGEALPGPLEVITAFYASGIASAVMLWVRQNMPYSTEEMAHCLAAMLPVQ